MFRQALHQLSIAVAGRRSRASRLACRKPSPQLQLEALEDRQLFALFPGESLVNTSTARDQSSPATAAAPDGRSVVVWTHEYSSSDTDIHAQRFDSAGNRVGSEIVVANSTRNEYQPDVAMDSAGHFVVTWTDAVTSGNEDIKARRFTSNGVAREAGSIMVATSNKNEYSSSVAMAAGGGFVIAWTVDQSVTNKDVQARMFRNDGFAIASSFSVASSSNNEEYPDVARSPDGRFAISYYTDINAFTVSLKRYSATGAAVGTHTIATSQFKQWNPRIGMDNNGNAMVVWQSEVGFVPGLGQFDILARRVTSGGVVEGIIRVNQVRGDKLAPSVAMKRDGSAFVVSHFSLATRSTEITELTASGKVRLRETVAGNTRLALAAVAFGGGGDYRVVYGRVAGSQGENTYLRRGRLS